VLYVVAEATRERPRNDGVVRLRWATDANPARARQTALFAQKYPGLAVTVDPGLGNDQTKLIVQCATGTGPDIIDVYDEKQMSSLIEAGVLVDLTRTRRRWASGRSGLSRRPRRARHGGPAVPLPVQRVGELRGVQQGGLRRPRRPLPQTRLDLGRLRRHGPAHPGHAVQKRRGAPPHRQLAEPLVLSGLADRARRALLHAGRTLSLADSPESIARCASTTT
jgi:hypothetical protein